MKMCSLDRLLKKLDLHEVDYLIFEWLTIPYLFLVKTSDPKALTTCRRKTKKYCSERSIAKAI